MTAHLHAALVPGCFRCELGQDEAAWAVQEAAEDAAREAACREHTYREFHTVFDDWAVCTRCGHEEQL